MLNKFQQDSQFESLYKQYEPIARTQGKGLIKSILEAMKLDSFVLLRLKKSLKL